MVYVDINNIANENLQEDFERGRISTATEFTQKTLAKKIILAKKEIMIMERFTEDFPIEGTATEIPKEEYNGNVAVEVSEWGDIPLFRSRMGSIPVVLTKNASRMEVSDESELNDPFGNLFDRNLRERGYELARKFDLDTCIVFENLASTSVGTASGDITVGDISATKGILEGAGYTATTIVMHPIAKAKLETEIVYQKLTYSDEVIKGGLIPTILGMEIVTTNAITPTVAVMLDETNKPILRVRNGKLKISKYDIPGKGRGAVFTEFVKPLGIDKETSIKITGA